VKQSNPEIVYRSSAEATPEVESSALAAGYGFIIDCHAKRAVAENRPENPERSSDEIRAKTRIP
jgi:hypothetical protein